MALHHFLAPPRALAGGPDGVLAMFERLGSIQFDPLEIAGRNHDLVLLARVAGYRREMTDRLLYEERALYETYNKGLSLVPVAELPFYRITWDTNRREHEAAAFDTHGLLVEELLERIRATGPLSATDIEPRAAIEWYWRPTNQVRAILEALAEAGILGLARRDGNRRVYDLIERLLPAPLLAERRPPDAQLRHKLLSRYRAHGLLGSSGPAELWYGTGKAPERSRNRAALVDEGALVPVVVDGIKGPRLLPAGERSRLEAAIAEVGAEASGSPRPGSRLPGVAFLGPLDPFVWDRDFLRTLHDFDYVWEVYVPAARRRWGYYVLPVLFGDRLVGRIEPRLEVRNDRLAIVGLWWEAGFEPLEAAGFVNAFAAALRAHQEFGGVANVAFPRVARGRAFVAAVRAALERLPLERSSRHPAAC